MSGVVHCKNDPTHKEFDTHSGKCKCGSKLQQTCSKCGKPKSYAHMKAHTAKCKAKPPLPPLPPPPLLPKIRFAYWASNWQLNHVRNKKAFRVPPRGQIWEGLPVGVPKKHNLRIHSVKEPSMRGEQWMDAYDALFASIASDTEAFQLVRVYHTWEEVLKALEDPIASLKGLDVLVLGNWVHQVTNDDGALPLEWLERLRIVELQTGCRIFPPLDYSVTFARKELVMQLLERCAIPAAKPIPTMAIFGEWREALDQFAQGHPTMVLKRSISETCSHVQFVETKDLAVFPFGTLPWLLQPVITEFEEHNELRLYVVNGRFLWGVSSSFREKGEDMSLFPFALGRVGSDWDPDAIKVAESLIAALARHQAHAARFLRIDMVRCNADRGWFINELEFFGNTYLHLDVGDDAHKMLPVLVECVKEWMRV
jgi:hypothetical protein